MQTLNKGKLLFSEAETLWEQMIAEDESMNRAVYWRMVEEQDHDPEWLAIDNILPRTPFNPTGENDLDMMKWLVRSMKMRLAWCRKWRLRNGA